jgi:putative membrane-bound dehydrogenase-like protein
MNQDRGEELPMHPFQSRLNAVARSSVLFVAMALAAASANAQSELVRGKHYHLTPAEAVAKMTVPEGFSVTLYAGEPDIRQPNAFAIDDRGRLWVAENYSYTKYGWQPDPRDRILVFADTDGDGRFDERKVFTEELTYASGIEVGYGGVWVGSPPNLLFYPDKDGDDVADGPPEVLLDGWGAEDQHETLNSFTWGPDGWLYGCHGVFTHSKVGKPGTPEKDRVPLNAGVWRYHPVRREFEVFAWGTSNPWGVDWDDHGQMLMTACVIPHLWHMVQGGRYHRQADKHFGEHVYDDLKTIADHSHQGFKGREGGFAHGGTMLYLGGSFPERYRGKLFMFNIHHRSIYVDALARKGSGFTGSHDEDFLFANDPWFIGFSLQYGPDGAVYFIDWYDEKVCHGQTPEGKETGRIYRVTYGGARAAAVDLGAKSDEELAALQLHENEWFVRHARRILGERAAAGSDLARAHSALRKTLKDHPSVPRKLRALWALHTSGGADERLLASLLSHENEYLRAWAVQLLCEGRATKPSALEKLAAMARDDPSPVVRLYLASALQRLEHLAPAARWPIAEGLLGHGEDAEDHNLPLMFWYGVEPLVAADRERALKVAATCKVPLVRKFIARRLAAE